MANEQGSLTIRIDPQMLRRIKIALINRKSNVSEWIRQEIEKFLEKEEKK